MERGKSSSVACGNRVERWTAKRCPQNVYTIVVNLTEIDEDELLRLEETNTNAATPSGEFDSSG